MTTRDPGSESRSSNVRPIVGVAPSISKNPGVIWILPTRSAWSPCPNVAPYIVDAAIVSKLWFCAFQSSKSGNEMLSSVCPVLPFVARMMTILFALG